jgi:hypothetical protein
MTRKSLLHLGSNRSVSVARDKSVSPPARMGSTALWPIVLLHATVGLVTSIEMARAGEAGNLADRLVPPFLTEYAANLCASTSRGFFKDHDEGFGTATNFAQHVKSEVTGSLSFPEASVVLRAAADIAKAQALAELRSLQTVAHTIEASRLETWCATVGRQIVEDALTAHARSHGMPQR